MLLKLALRAFSTDISHSALATTLANQPVPSKKMVEYMFNGIALNYGSSDIDSIIQQLNKCTSKKEYRIECRNSLTQLIEKNDPAIFGQIKFLRCNIDQLMSFLGSANFVINGAPEKVIECLAAVAKSNEITLYKRPEILNAIHHLIKTDIIFALHPTQVNSIIWILAKMTIDDITLWLACFKAVAYQSSSYDCRCLSNIVTNIYKGSRIFKSSFNFSDIMYTLEKTIISRFNIEKPDSQSLAMVCVAYSKQQMGSVEFLRELERFIVPLLHTFKTQEIANILYSYSKLENADISFFKDVIPLLYKMLPTFKPMEFCQLLYAIDKAKICNFEMYEKILYYFVDKWELCNSEDVSEFYFFVMKNYREHKYLSKFAEHMERCVRRLYRTMTAKQIIKMYSFPNSRVELVKNIAKLRMMAQLSALLEMRKLDSSAALRILGLLREIAYKSSEEEDMIARLSSYIDNKSYLANN